MLDSRTQKDLVELLQKVLDLAVELNNPAALRARLQSALDSDKRLAAVQASEANLSQQRNELAQTQRALDIDFVKLREMRADFSSQEKVHEALVRDLTVRTNELNTKAIDLSRREEMLAKQTNALTERMAARELALTQREQALAEERTHLEATREKMRAASIR